ncbi:MAG: hypothetical protein ACK2UT_15895, partial [Candidatus Promineifilaceae bacterium]
MRILTRLLAFVLLPAAYLCSASAVHATSCYMAWYLIDVCEAQEDTGASAANSSGEPLFITPDLPEDSLFARRWYGRLADNANVYAS